MGLSLIDDTHLKPDIPRGGGDRAILWRYLRWWPTVVGFAADREAFVWASLQDVGGLWDHHTLLTWGKNIWEANLIFNAFSLAKGWERQIPGNRGMRSVCLAISAVTESAHSGFFVLGSWQHPAHLSRPSDSHTVSSCEHNIWIRRTTLLYAPDQDLFLLFTGAAYLRPSVKAWVRCSHGTSNGYAFPCSLVVTLYFCCFTWKMELLFIFLMQKGCLFCLKSCFRFWKTTKGGRRLQKGWRCSSAVQNFYCTAAARL